MIVNKKEVVFTVKTPRTPNHRSSLSKQVRYRSTRFINIMKCQIVVICKNNYVNDDTSVFLSFSYTLTTEK